MEMVEIVISKATQVKTRLKAFIACNIYKEVIRLAALSSEMVPGRP